jgi:hypothetical protein
LSTSQAGDLLLTWIEGIDSELCFVDTAFERVNAASAPAGQSFGPPHVLSPLGAVEPDSPGLASALSNDGRRLTAWNSGALDATAPRSLVAAIGDGTSDLGTRDDDHVSPNASLSFTRAMLSRAAATGTLIGRLRCSERCAVRVSFGPSHFSPELDTLPVQVVDPGGFQRVRWSLTVAQRRTARRLVRESHSRGLAATADVIDASGNQDTTDQQIASPGDDR